MGHKGHGGGGAEAVLEPLGASTPRDMNVGFSLYPGLWGAVSLPLAAGFSLPQRKLGVKTRKLRSIPAVPCLYTGFHPPTEWVFTSP